MTWQAARITSSVGQACSGGHVGSSSCLQQVQGLKSLAEALPWAPLRGCVASRLQKGITLPCLLHLPADRYQSNVLRTPSLWHESLTGHRQQCDMALADLMGRLMHCNVVSCLCIAICWGQICMPLLAWWLC